LALGALSAAALAGFLIFPVYANYDSMYHLAWAREILGGSLPGFDDTRAPTEHPLWLALCVVLAPMGGVADRVLVAICIGCFVATVAGLYSLGKAVFSPLVGAIAAVLLLTRLDFAFLAARGYVDVAYLALLIWAAVLEVRRPRRGGAVWVLLALAGLLRPEGWVLAALYAVYLGRRTDWARRARCAAYAAVGPGIWAAVDLAVTGDPMYSLNYTTESAATLGRRKDLIELPGTMLHYLDLLTKWPVLLAGTVGVGLAAWLARDRLLVPLTLLTVGLGTFLGSSLRGFSVIYRYLMPAALIVMLFAAFALAAPRWLPGGSALRRPLSVAAVLLALAAGGFSATNFSTRSITNELALRGSVREQLASLLAQPAVRDARSCGPVSLPNHKLVPDVRWVLDSDAQEVLPRTTRPEGGRDDDGVAIFIFGAFKFLKHQAYGPFDQEEDSPLIQVPAAGAVRVASTRNFAAYVRCAPGGTTTTG